MYNNYQQPPAYESLPTDIYAQPIYSSQFEQAPYMDSTYINQQAQPIYQTIPQQQQQPPLYQGGFQEASPIYQTSPQQPPPIYQQPSPVYQTLPQQPPTYTASVQPQQQQQQYSAPVLQQPTSINTNVSANNSRPPGTPFSKGYKWPRKTIPVVCPQCGATITTRVETSITVMTIIGAIVLCIFTCILVCLPFCIPACKRSTHYCPNCNSVLGKRGPLQ